MNGPRPYSAHLGYLFTELPFRERFRAAARHGFSGVEHPAPFAVPAAEMASWLAEIGLPFVQFGLHAGNTAGGEKGLAIFAERREEFRDSVFAGLDYATAIGTRMVHVMAGVLPEAERQPAHWDLYVENLAFAADAASERGLTIIVEAMSADAVPGYFVETPGRAAAAIAATGRPNLRLLLDIFHTASSGLEIGAEINRLAGLLAHVHIADRPGRNEPGSGTIDFPAVLAALDAAGYAGFLGCEYSPKGRTQDGLGWMPIQGEAS